MRDLLRSKNPKSYDMTFGGKIIVFGGDFRQIIPVVPKGTRQDIVGASINSSYLWRSCDGVVGNSTDGEADITIPDNLLLKCDDDPIAAIVDSTFSLFRRGIGDLSYLKNSVILAPTLDVVDSINQYMNDHDRAEGMTYLSCDSICKSDSNVDMLSDLHTLEFLNGLDL
ncbi:PREDICTED: uncharacterized protein LOC109157638 [Ipomoea nil]|uniref:uncharacterized protein LOC109157638 n=1 Tax=Ipomoea nil TaxID=35883 RepID=UPI000900B21E|nr:PREDICTED: uncharacterized protein LOC109157638 [Ipomoea nil]